MFKHSQIKVHRKRRQISVLTEERKKSSTRIEAYFHLLPDVAGECKRIVRGGSNNH